MSKFFVALSFAAAASYSGGLVTFSAGSPAKAEEVNRNFSYLDSAKASVSSVDVLTSAVSAKADKSALESKTDDSRTDSLAKALIAKADTSVWRAVKDSAASMREALGKVSTGGNGSLSTLAVGTTKSYGGAAAFQYNGTGGDWNEGIVLVPTPKYNGANIFFRANQTNSDSAICFGRRGGGLGVTMQQLKFSPFSIDASGNTTIGGSLTANGKILADAAQITDLRVAGSLKTAPTEPWADYVFEPGYKPMSLKEIEAFAKANGHLPEVPSAAEVQKDGIDLARMNAILLKKIEELTLHAVEQERKMEALQAEVQEMKTGR